MTQSTGAFTTFWMGVQSALMPPTASANPAFSAAQNPPKNDRMPPNTDFATDAIPFQAADRNEAIAATGPRKAATSLFHQLTKNDAMAPQAVLTAVSIAVQAAFRAFPMAATGPRK